MNFKKILAIVLTIVLCMSSALTVMAEEPEIQDNVITIECVNETREITISGERITQPKDTVVTLFVWNPGYGLSDIATVPYMEVCCYGNETAVDSGNEFSFDFTLDENAISGIYNVSIYVPGMKSPYQGTFTYENIKRADEVVKIVMDEVKGQDLNEVLNAFDYGLTDVNASAGLVYRKYTGDQSAKKTYVAQYVIDNGPIVDKEDLKNKIGTVVGALESVKTAANGDRETIKKLVEDSKNPMLISSEALSAYGALDDNKKEKALADYLGVDAKDWVYPEDVTRSINAAVTGVNKPSDTITNSNPSPDVDRDDNVSVEIGSEVIKDSKENNSKEEFAGDVKPAFSDLASVPWAYSAITILADKGVVNGKGNSLFCPGDLITREEFVKLIVTALDLRHGSQKILPFEDVSAGVWYADPVIIAYNSGIVKGISATEFGVGAPITRQDMVTMLYSAMNFAGYSVTGDADATYNDGANIAAYARTPVETFTKAGLVSGRGEGMFVPNGTATRAEAATIIYRLLYGLKLI